ncbi:DUF1501 domain-containing protein [Stieleria sp. TO1_6]|uniref:DUF1501 domain-containing protein n=1 Tax=Stieleria tagensis TaxID=2956795 RepID=UPI00209AAFDE|nr:DUF1501 domain-containing protein [Stieleria tagensis]MCO8123504.1 DUF1501 domain-containing protein [Stieleria tagensis]
MSDQPADKSRSAWQHSRCSRRDALQAGAIGILGLGMNHLVGLRQATASEGSQPSGKAKSCIFIFLSGGLSQHDSFDMKPDAPDNIRGEFRPRATRTPGLQICEHLPKLAERSNLWSLCRSLTHSSNEHSAAHHIMLTGHSELPTGFSPNNPSRSDRASIAAVTGYAMREKQQNNLPTAVVLPERLVHSSGRVIPGQHAGAMGAQYDPWMIEASPFHNTSYGAFPKFAFDHQDRGKPDGRLFQAPQLSLPDGLGMQAINGRLALLESLNRQRENLASYAQVENFDRLRQGAVSLLTESSVHQALDVTNADEKHLDRYGHNSFGWSLLMARRLVGSGVSLVQVNLGNDETWDTHGNAFPHLKNNLFPPTDQALSALLDDLHSTGELDETLIVVAGEFGRTPQITLLEKHYQLPGRDHWGAVQSVLFAGGGIHGGNVVGKSDAHGAYPDEQPVKPENFAATIYDALGIPATAAWHDAENRPHHIYHGEPIAGLI